MSSESADTGHQAATTERQAEERDRAEAQAQGGDHRHPAGVCRVRGGVAEHRFVDPEAPPRHVLSERDGADGADDRAGHERNP